MLKIGILLETHVEQFSDKPLWNAVIMFQVVLDRVSKTGEIRMPTLSSAKLNLLTIVFLVACGSVTFAQHDPSGGPGGGTIGGGSTGRPASKPPKRPATAPRRTTAST